MKRRAKTELGTFSVSAIDLFASALGAFIIIALVLLPYFPNLSPNPLMATIEQLKADKSGLETTLNGVSSLNASLSAKIVDLSSTVRNQVATISQQGAQLAQSQSRITAAQQAATLAQAAAQQATASAQSSAQAAASAMADKDKLISTLNSKLSGSAFIGIEPKYDDITLVIDYSGSTATFKSQIDGVVELIIDRLEPGRHSLRIIGYSDKDNALNFVYWPSKGKYDQSLDVTAKSSAISFVRNRDILEGTPTKEVLEEVLSIGPASSIFLITDGEPNGVSTPDEVIALSNYLTSINTTGHQINVVAVGKFAESKFASGIAGLARSNYGALVAMP